MSGTGASRAVSLVAKTWSLLSIGFVLAFVFGDIFNGNGARPTNAEWIGLALWPIGVALGLVVAWFRNALGGSIALASLIAFYIWNFLERGNFPKGPYFMLVAAPGMLFLLSSLLSRPRQHVGPA